ncbi:NAD(P)-dependent dehydrogenase, short-chain alcohol dehydrogenase family [Marinobacter persicus]|uniref:NAD(P)-dependent dehydrogenase, short-chain alcohol dehydrogenase family n=1 Tax=Marinobacter persicus TaxID=930118 RepID=A0A1I3T6V3_9GAMM|nr:SDR family NAD(P)-dependent oxidoreductase [Marinobacter persicus]GHD40394.1 SDR family oxidoreductase [Marinobacter persicus]SFJ65541.1 NAD(P)-dependent dehydrogenase, short-chain alcohol dehydrogenase family [Marinobacter persicus]
MTTLIAGVSGAIGSALAERYLAQTQETVIGLCRKPEAVSFRLRDDPRVRLLPWQADAPESLPVDRLADLLASREPLINVVYATGLLHDAAMFPEKRLEDMQPRNMIKAFEVNCLGFGLLMQALAPHLRGRHLKRVAAVSAKVGSVSDNHLGGWYAYRCSKAALNMLVKNLSVELPRRCAPIACVALHPGTTRSALSEPFSQSLAKLTVHEPDETADNLFRVLESLSDKDNGQFINWDGSDLPW